MISGPSGPISSPKQRNPIQKQRKSLIEERNPSNQERKHLHKERYTPNHRHN